MFREQTMLGTIASGMIVVWTVILVGLCVWNIGNEKLQTTSLLQFQNRAFYKEIVTTRTWNAGHGGVYVPVTPETQPNQYLKDPFRDVVTMKGMKLTKINPAYMTRQIAELAMNNKNIWFHITSANPLRPKNMADPWEMDALRSFALGEEEFFGYVAEKDRTLFRYMAPLWVEKSCLKCHSDQGYKEGDLRGGISVTVVADPALSVMGTVIRQFSSAYLSIWIAGLAVIYFGYYRLRREEKKRLGVIAELQQSLKQIKKLRGLLPICAHCKKIRDDKGYWNYLESYMQENADVTFSHSVCDDCVKKYYPDLDLDEDEKLPADDADKK